MVFRQSRLSDRARRRDTQKGVVAVEFALLAPIFFGMMFSICEVGWVFFTEAVMERAEKDAIRMIRTGQVQQISQENDPDAQRQAVFDKVCRFVSAFGECEEELAVEVETFDSFNALAESNTDVTCSDNAGYSAGSTAFEPGDEESIVRMRICILYDTLNPLIGISLKSTEGDGNRMIAQHIFRNEPYERNIRD